MNPLPIIRPRHSTRRATTRSRRTATIHPVVLRAEFEAHGNRIAVAFRATNALRYGEERALRLRVAPHTRLPGVAMPP